METKFRCDCPITSALDVLGDRWTLVIVKQMLMEGRCTFKDFVESDEAIATNILSARLKLLEKVGIISKSKPPHNKKTNLYRLTERGIALAPIIAELAFWSDQHLREFNPIIADTPEMEFLRQDRAGFARVLESNYRAQISDNSGVD
ncbi:MAG: helix-turn-helix domain-containing protein [Bacteroidota bacterium]